jgi:hypothetical protein
MLYNGVRSDWLSYSMERTGDNGYGIIMATTGFNQTTSHLPGMAPSLPMSGAGKYAEA